MNRNIFKINRTIILSSRSFSTTHNSISTITTTIKSKNKPNSYRSRPTTTTMATSNSTTDNKEKSHGVKLGDRMKTYEGNYSYKIEKNQSFIVRLDGHGFSKFTKCFNKPWDIRIHNAMVKTSEALLKSFNPTSIYTFSDEITMCFPSIPEIEGVEIAETIYSGKIQKLTTLASGLASTVFYKSITSPEDYDSSNENDKKILEHLAEALPHFDARLFVVPSNQVIVENLVWRSTVDCRRNSISGLGLKHFPHKQLEKVDTNTIKSKLLIEKGINYEDEPDWYKYGVYLKRQNKMVTSFSPFENKQVTALRTKFIRFSFNIKYLKDNLKFITDKVLPEDYQLEFKDDKSKDT